MSAYDLILRGARIYTADDELPWATAIAITGGRVAAVGDEAAADGWGKAAEVIDLGGALLMPGFVDAHNHYAIQGQTQLYEHLVDPNLTLDELLAEVAKAVEGVPEGGWAVVSPYSAAVASSLERAESLRRLDEAAQGHPVIVREYSRHNRWVSSAALAAAGIDTATPDPDDGAIVRDPDTGDLTGVLYESAGIPVERAFLAARGFETSDYRAMAREGMRILNGYGITALSDAAASWEIMQATKELDEAEEATAWVVSCMPANDQIFGFPVIGDALFAQADGVRSTHHRPDFVKIFLDGVPPARTACFSTPYLPQPGDEPGHEEHGETLFSLEELTEVLRSTADLGLSAKIHCTGDGSVHLALDAVAAVRAAGYTEARYHLAHCQFILPEDIPRFAELGVVAEISPYFWVPGPVPEAIGAVLGPGPLERMHPNRELLDAGAAVVVGSDWPCSETPNVWQAIHGLVTRTDPTGLAPGALVPEQAVSLDEALKMTTRDAAEALGLGAWTGSLMEGKAADFVVLDRDPFQIPSSELASVRVTETWFGGRQVFIA